MDNDLQGFGFVLPHWAYWGWLAIMPFIFIFWGARKKILPPLPYDEDSGPIERAIDWLSDRSGLFVALWTVNAVIFHTYEVSMR